MLRCRIGMDCKKWSGDKNNQLFSNLLKPVFIFDFIRSFLNGWDRLP